VQDALKKYNPILKTERAHPRDENYDEHLRLLEGFVEPGDLLDVGSHGGFFLRRARDRGWRTCGVEPSTTMSRIAREQLRLDVRSGSLFDAGFPSSSFDVVTMVDVLEHVAKPRELLAEIRRVLRPGGRVFIKVPNVRYVLAKHYLLGRLPSLIEDVFDAREHLVFYSYKTLARVLEQTGFDLELFVVPSPIQAGGFVRRVLRRAGTAVAKRLPLGVALPLATDIVAIGRKGVVLETEVPSERQGHSRAAP
jgi:2-polyprenyl-3-methyl-5-hydroxy-6-metoxy-1,4-benzoquinol methylase